MKKITLEELEDICKQLDLPEVKSLGGGLYKITPPGIICGESFLQKLDEELKREVKEWKLEQINIKLL